MPAQEGKAMTQNKIAGMMVFKVELPFRFARLKISTSLAAFYAGYESTGRRANPALVLQAAQLLKCVLRLETRVLTSFFTAALSKPETSDR